MADFNSKYTGAQVEVLLDKVANDGYEGRIQSLESIVGAMASVYSGSGAPSDSIGKDGDIYIQV